MIYLDSAATTFQKPPSVAEAVGEAMRTMSSPGRGGYPAAMRAADVVFQCRSALAELFQLRNPEQVVFTMNATHGLNLAIKTLVSAGDEVVISGYEHNAVTRPLAALGAKITVAEAPLFQPEAAAEAFERCITPTTKAVICNHVSNVFGFIQPVEEIAAICAARQVPLIVDASQSAGILPLDMESLQAAFIAMPGHKGLYGPQGTGVLLCREDVVAKTLLEGGTGSLSALQQMPDFLPDRLEAGTHNVPGIAGLLAGVRYLQTRGISTVFEQERQLALLAAECIRGFGDVRVFAEAGLRNQAGVLSVVPERKDVEEIGAELADRGIAVRAGLHCAPMAHRSAGTLETGTVRISFSDFNTREEVYCFLEEFRRILSM